jgi:phospholipid transport system substrate-binding protein
MMTLRATTAVLALFFFGVTGNATAQTPGEQVQETIQRVTAIVGSSAGGDAARRDAIKRLLTPRFDWNEMARQALGKHWPSAHEKQNEFIATFTEFVGNGYIGQIGSYKDEKIIYLGERRESNRAQVDTKVVPTKGDPLSVNYKLHQVSGEWKIYDVVIEDISLVHNYRSQFNRVLAKSSLDELLRQLKEKDSKDRS